MRGTPRPTLSEQSVRHGRATGPLVEGSARNGPFDAIVIFGGVEELRRPDRALEGRAAGIVAVFWSGPFGRGAAGAPVQATCRGGLRYCERRRLAGFEAVRQFSSSDAGGGGPGRGSGRCEGGVHKRGGEGYDELGYLARGRGRSSSALCWARWPRGEAAADSLRHVRWPIALPQFPSCWSRIRFLFAGPRDDGRRTRRLRKLLSAL